MVYLVGPRITFAGRFQADVSTINNEVRYYYNTDFKPEYQVRQPSGADPEGGWWNPDGSGAFRLKDCTVRGALWSDGTFVTDASKDAAIGLFVGDALGRAAGKMVDLDPQMQMVSQLWGVGMRLTNGKVPGFVAGDYHVAAFRDLNMRQPRTCVNGQPMGAAYTSVLRNLVWTLDGLNSPALQQIKAIVDAHGPEAELSVRMSVYNYSRVYQDSPAANAYTFGSVVGAIGVQMPGQPKTFVLGRRFAPTSPPAGGMPQSLTYFDAVVDPSGMTVSVDLGNALPLDRTGAVDPGLGPLTLAVLPHSDSVQGGQPSYIGTGSQVTTDQYVVIGDIPYAEPNWYEQNAGIARLAIPSAAQALIGDKPLALIQTRQDETGIWRIVIARETVMGYMVRADDFVHRLNPQSQYPYPQPTDSVPVAVYAAQWGKPYDSSGLAVQQSGWSTDAGTGNQDDLPMPVPIMGWPYSVVTQTCGTFSGGCANLTVTATDPDGARLIYYTPPEPTTETPVAQTPLTAPYMDGQIYQLLIQLQETSGWQAPGGQQHFLDGVMLHVRDGYAYNPDPTWEEVQPIFTQYANLYPVMSKRLVDLSNEQSVSENSHVIEFAFSLPMADSNFMPVTRDLSPAKQQTLITYLQRVQGKQPAPPPTRLMAAAPVEASVGQSIPALDRAQAARRARNLNKSQAAKNGGSDA